MSKSIIVTVLLALLVFDGLCQDLDRSMIGFNFRFGESMGKDDTNNPQLQMSNSLYISTSEGLIFLFKTKPIKKNEVAILPYIKTELSHSSRSGLFNINNSLTRLTTSNLELTVILPNSFKVNENIFPYLGIGVNGSFNLFTNSYPGGNAPSIPPKFGLVTDMGISFKGERIISLLGCRLMTEYGLYSFNEYHFYYSIAVKPRKKK